MTRKYQPSADEKRQIEALLRPLRDPPHYSTNYRPMTTGQNVAWIVVPIFVIIILLSL